MPSLNSNAKVPFDFDLEFKLTPDDRLDPVVDFDDLPGPAGKGLKTAEMALEDAGLAIFEVNGPDNGGLLDA